MPLLRAFLETYSAGVKYVTPNKQVGMWGTPQSWSWGCRTLMCLLAPEPPLSWGIPVLCRAVPASAKPRRGLVVTHHGDKFLMSHKATSPAWSSTSHQPCLLNTFPIPFHRLDPQPHGGHPTSIGVCGRPPTPFIPENGPRCP